MVAHVLFHPARLCMHQFLAMRAFPRATDTGSFSRLAAAGPARATAGQPTGDLEVRLGNKLTPTNLPDPLHHLSSAVVDVTPACPSGTGR